MSYYPIDCDIDSYRSREIFDYVRPKINNQKDSIYIVYNPFFSRDGRRYNVSRFDVIYHIDNLLDYGKGPFIQQILKVDKKLIEDLDYTIANYESVMTKFGWYHHTKFFFHLKDLNIFPEEIQEQLLMRLDIL